MVRVERSMPAPASLSEESKKKNGSCNKPDVVERLKKDFHDKCYICEMKGLQDPQVEHLVPHMSGKYPERKYDWNNLFWACGHCNLVKNKHRYTDGIIDCCRLDPELYLTFYVINDSVSVVCGDNTSATATITAELIEEVFGADHTGMRENASAMRMDDLRKNMNAFFRCLKLYRSDRQNCASRRKITALLRRESAFVAFKRCYIRQRLVEYPEFKEICDFD